MHIKSHNTLLLNYGLEKILFSNEKIMLLKSIPTIHNYMLINIVK